MSRCSRSNRTRTLLFTSCAIVLIGLSLAGLVGYVNITTQRQAAQMTTRTAQSAITSTFAAYESATACCVGATVDTILNLVGTYVGSYRLPGSSSSTIRLEIAQQEGAIFSGFCILGGQSYPLVDGRTTLVYSGADSGGIFFTIDVPSSPSRKMVSLDFSGSATREGTMAGVMSDRNGREGTWSVKKS